MSAINPAAALLGMVMYVAQDEMLDSVDRLTPELAGVNAEAIPENLRGIFHAAYKVLTAGRSPTQQAILLADPSLKGSTQFSACFKAADASEYDLSTARKALMQQYGLKVLAEQAALVQKAVKAGQLEEAEGIWAKLNLDALHGRDEGEGDLLDHELPTEEERRPFQLTLQNLNVALGGGLGAGGNLGMSLWILPSGSGKSALWYGQVPHLCEQGNWVIYCAGEASKEDVINEVVRLRSQTTAKAFMSPNRLKVPMLQEKAQKTLDEMKAFSVRGQFRVMENFSAETLKRKVLQVKGEMKKANATGKLIVIVDNYDTLASQIPAGKEGNQLASVNAEIDRLFHHTRKHDYHIAWLAQTDTKAAKTAGPCGADDVYGNRNLRAKMAHVVTGYRPITSEAFNDTDKDGRLTYGARAWLAVRKLRGPGEYAEIEMVRDNPYGAWVEVNALPF